MSLNRTNVILLIVVVLLVLFQIVLSYNSGCSPGSYCMGPREITIFGIPFSTMLPTLLSFSLLITFIGTVIIGLPYYFIKKPEDKLNPLVRISSILFTIGTVLSVLWMSMIKY